MNWLIGILIIIMVAYGLVMFSLVDAILGALKGAGKGCGRSCSQKRRNETCSGDGSCGHKDASYSYRSRQRKHTKTSKYFAKPVNGDE